MTRSMILVECDLTFKCIIKVRFNSHKKRKEKKNLDSIIGLDRPCCVYDCLLAYKNEHHWSYHNLIACKCFASVYSDMIWLVLYFGF